MLRNKDLDIVWKALADPTRRAILDLLRDGPQPTSKVVERFPELSRFAVMKHMGVLRAAGLLTSTDRGRTRVNWLNAVPLKLIYQRWVSKFEDQWAQALVDIRDKADADKQ